MKVGQVTHPISTPNGFHILKLVAKRNAIKPHHKTLYQVRHILYRAAKGDYSDSVKKRIQVLEKEIHKTGKFAELAKKYSEDIMSGEKGGNIGWIDARDMTPAFANAVRKLPLHKMSKPIRSQFGWHLIEVTGKKQVDDRMEVFKERIAEQLFHREFESKMKDWIQTLRSRSYIVVKTA